MLLDDDVLVKQIVSLERRTSRGGRDSIDHPPGQRDDLANAVAGALVLASKPVWEAPSASFGTYGRTCGPGESMWNGAYHILPEGTPDERFNSDGGFYEKFDCTTGMWVDMRTLRNW